MQSAMSIINRFVNY